jgi:hypothetical protein
LSYHINSCEANLSARQNWQAQTPDCPVLKGLIIFLFFANIGYNMILQYLKQRERKLFPANLQQNSEICAVKQSGSRSRIFWTEY